MDPKDLTKLDKQEHFMLDSGIYLVFQNVGKLDQLSRLKLDAANQDIEWELTNGNSVHYQVTYKQNHRLEDMMNTFLAESLDKQHRFQPKVESYIYWTNLSYPLGKSYQNPEHFGTKSHVFLRSKDMNDDQKTLIRKTFRHGPVKDTSATFKKFWKYFWKRLAIQQPDFNEDDDISRNNELVSRLIKSVQNNPEYQVNDNDLIVLATVLNPLRRLLNCNLWANSFDYQHHVYVPGSKIQAILKPNLDKLKKD